MNSALSEPRGVPFRLRLATAAGLGAVLLLSTMWFVQRVIVRPGLQEAELRLAAASLDAFESRLALEVGQLAALVGFWADAEDTWWRHLSGKADPSHGAMDLGRTASRLNLDLLVVLDDQGRLVAGHERNGDGEAGLDALPSWLKTLARIREPFTGLRMAPGGPFLLARADIVHPVLGASAGTVLAGRRFQPRLAALDGEGFGELTISATESAADTGKETSLTASAWAATDRVIRLHGDTIFASMALPSLPGAPGLTARLSLERPGFAVGFAPLALPLLIQLAALGMAAFGVWHVLSADLLQPLRRTADALRTARLSPEASEPFPTPDNEYLAPLVREYGALQARISESDHEILRQTYRLGMAEMASEVIHNLRNSYTPLKTRLHMLQEACRTDAPSETSAPSTLERNVADLCRLAGDIDRDIQSLNRFGLASRPVESLDMASLVQDAKRFVPPKLQDDLGLVVDPSLAHMSPVLGNRVTLLEVVSNIFVNAVEISAGAGAGWVEVRVRAENTLHDGVRMLRLDFRDTGPGLDPDSLARIFERRYSSHRHGLGLHWCACAVSEMGGRLRAETPSTGKGLSLLLELPLDDSSAS